MPPDSSSSSIAFGPPNNQWTYTPAKRTYSLARDSSGPPFVFPTTRGPPDISIAVASKHTALVVVDMQNYFLHPSCREHPSGLAAVPRVLEAVAKCREVGIKIIWLNWGLSDSDLRSMPAAATYSFGRGLVDPPSAQDNQDQDGDQNGTAGPRPFSRCTFGCDMGEGRGRVLMAGSWNAELYGPLREVASYDTDIFVSKDRTSGAWNQDTEFLRALEASAPGGSSRIKTLLFAGVNTNQCVLGTLLDAYNRGFDCVMLEDCCATTTPGGQDMCVLDVSRVYGFVTDSAAFQRGELGA